MCPWVGSLPGGRLGGDQHVDKKEVSPVGKYGRASHLAVTGATQGIDKCSINKIFVVVVVKAKDGPSQPVQDQLRKHKWKLPICRWIETACREDEQCFSKVMGFTHEVH